jgi:hypothetical protein
MDIGKGLFTFSGIFFSLKKKEGSLAIQHDRGKPGVSKIKQSKKDKYCMVPHT